MLPAANGFPEIDFEVAERPSNTFRWDRKSRIFGNIDGAEAMEQAIYLALQTERYKYVIYTRGYGVELADLYGQPMSYFIPEVKRRVEEALLCDTRITRLESFVLEAVGSALHVSFTAVTIFGEIPITERYEGLS